MLLDSKVGFLFGVLRELISVGFLHLWTIDRGMMKMRCYTTRGHWGQLVRRLSKKTQVRRGKCSTTHIINFTAGLWGPVQNGV